MKHDGKQFLCHQRTNVCTRLIPVNLRMPVFNHRGHRRTKLNIIQQALKTRFNRFLLFLRIGRCSSS